MDIYFITGNKGKVLTLQKSFELADRLDIKIIQKDLNIIEPQLDSIAEVSKYKALQAYEILKVPVIVEDGGLILDALGGFPGVYSKYILGTIGVDGILKLLEGTDNRTANFLSFTTFIDEKGNIQQFERDVIEYDIALEKSAITSPFAWSELWKIIYVREFGKLLCDFTKEDLDEYYKIIEAKGSLQRFSNWFINKY